jgi:hypothetical protein
MVPDPGARGGVAALGATSTGEAKSFLMFVSGPP